MMKIAVQTNNTALQKAHNVLVYKNISALVVTLMLGIFVILTAWGQLSYLESLKKEYSGLFERLKSQFQDESSAIDGEVSSLDARHTVVWLTLWFALICTVIVVVITVVLFIQSF